MKPLPHRYDAHLSGGPLGHAQLSAAGMPALPAAPPLEYDGPGDAWSPEHLLLASVQACFLFTLRAIARASALEFLSLDLDASGTVDRPEGITRFTEIVLRPTITVRPDVDRERVLQILEKTKTRCLVSASLSVPVRLEPAVVASHAHAPAVIAHVPPAM